jgi:dTDP-4-dehydrorhamnose reductase
MNILITGAGGQLGRDCLQRLEKKHTVFGCTSDRLDITDQKQVRQTLRKVLPEVAINCAAYTAVDTCETEEAACRAVNGRGAANLARACAEIRCRLIHISTDYVFDGNKNIPQEYTEQDPVAPLSAYGRSKLAGEQAIARETANFLILRTAWLYGEHGKNFLKTMLRLAVTDPGRVVRVVDDQFGSLTWTRSLARQIEMVLDADLTGIVHATAEGWTTWYRGAKYFLDTMQVEHCLEPCTTAEYPTPATRPANSILANNRLKSAGLHVMQDWKQDIDDFVALHREKLLHEARTG